MQTPKRKSIEEVTAEYDLFVSSLLPDGPENYKCAGCHNRIVCIPVAIHVHLDQYEMCSGPGLTLKKYIPFCESCEMWPDPQGCIHYPYSDVKIIVAMRNYPLFGQ